MSQNVTDSVSPRPREDAEVALARVVDSGADLGILLLVGDEHPENVGDSLAAEAGGVEGDAGSAKHSLS